MLLDYAPVKLLETLPESAVIECQFDKDTSGSVEVQTLRPMLPSSYHLLLSVRSISQLTDTLGQVLGGGTIDTILRTYA